MSVNRVYDYVGLFFYVDGIFLLHVCTMDKAEESDGFLNLPKSHYEIWEKDYAAEYHVVRQITRPRVRQIISC